MSVPSPSSSPVSSSPSSLRVDLPALPALVFGHVVHDRRGPVRHRFRNRHHGWLVEVPADGSDPALAAGGRLARVLARVARIRAEDHLDRGRLGGGLHGDLRRWLGSRGVELAPGDRVLLLAQPRWAGYVFNPLSVWWVLRAAPPLHLPLRKCRDHSTYEGVAAAGRGDAPLGAGRRSPTLEACPASRSSLPWSRCSSA